MIKRYDVRGYDFDVVECDTGSFVEYDALPPEPEWLDAPDGDGVWWFVGERFRNALMAIEVDTSQGCMSCYQFGTENEYEISDLTGKWQRINPPTLPKQE